jgi:hypothetical protein
MPMLKIATKQMADGFAKVWKYGRVSIFLDDVHKQFATDFANMIVTSFVADQQAKAAKAAELKKIKVVEN